MGDGMMDYRRNMALFAKCKTCDDTRYIEMKDGSIVPCPLCKRRARQQASAGED